MNKLLGLTDLSRMPGLMPVNQEPIVIVVATPSLSLDALQIEIKLYLQNFSAYTVLMSGNVSLDLVLEMLDCNTVLLISRENAIQSHVPQHVLVL